MIVPFGHHNILGTNRTTYFPVVEKMSLLDGKKVWTALIKQKPSENIWLKMVKYTNIIFYTRG